jgi:hypothetical protein
LRFSSPLGPLDFASGRATGNLRGVSGEGIAVSIAQVISVINQMEADGIVTRYAIGGAVRATFYLEPVATLDVDIFVAFCHQPDQVMVNWRPCYQK